MIVLDVMSLHPGLNVRIMVLAFAFYFIAADVEVRIRKKRCHLRDDGIEELVGPFLRRVERRSQGVEVTSDDLDLPRRRC